MDDETMTTAASDGIVSTQAQHTPGPWTLAPGDGELDHKAKFKTRAEVLVFAPLDCREHPIADCSCNHTCRLDLDCEANARLIAAAPAMLEVIKETRALVAEAAMTGFNCKEGNWAERLFINQAKLSDAVIAATGSRR